MPNLFVVTGANGAGKSTLSSTLLPDNLSDLSVFDGDKLFIKTLSEIFPSQMKSPKYARDMAFEATIAEFEKLVKEALGQSISFAYEGHFSSESPWQTIKRFKVAGYHVVMMFLMVESLSISLKRVAERVKTGGHYVTPQEIEKNYYGNLYQLNKHFELIDELILIDNSSIRCPNQILVLSNGQIVKSASKSAIPVWLKLNLPAIYEKAMYFLPE